MAGPMDAMMGFFNRSGGNGGQGQNVQQPQSGQAPQQGEVNPQGVNTNDPNALGSSDPNKQQSPEVLYKDLFSDPIPGSGQEDTPPQYKIDSNHLKTVSDSLDFSRDMPPELLEKLQNGEQLSGQDFVAAINHVGRRVYATAMEHQSSVTGKFVDLHSKHSLKGLPLEVRKQMTMSHIQNDPIANNPMAQEHVQEIAKRLQAKHPNASPEWIKQQSREYFVNMAKAVNPEAFAGESSGQGSSQRGQQAQSVDWDAFVKT